MKAKKEAFAIAAAIKRRNGGGKVGTKETPVAQAHNRDSMPDVDDPVQSPQDARDLSHPEEAQRPTIGTPRHPGAGMVGNFDTQKPAMQPGLKINSRDMADAIIAKKMAEGGLADDSVPGYEQYEDAALHFAQGGMADHLVGEDDEFSEDDYLDRFEHGHDMSEDDNKEDDEEEGEEENVHQGMIHEIMGKLRRKHYGMRED